MTAASGVIICYSNKEAFYNGEIRYHVGSGGTVSSIVNVFRANRGIDLVITISINPARQSVNSLWNSIRLSLVPVSASSALNLKTLSIHTILYK